VKTIKKSRQNLVKLAEELLVPLGFTRAGSSLVRERDCCYQIINFQGSSYCSWTYVNQMVWFKALGPLPSPVHSGTFHFSSRMESRTPSEEPRWRLVLEASSASIDRAAWKDQLAALLATGLPDYELLLTPSDARTNHLAKRVSGLLVPAIAVAGA
jgi:hypothetical protein